MHHIHARRQGRRWTRGAATTHLLDGSPPRMPLRAKRVRAVHTGVRPVVLCSGAVMLLRGRCGFVSSACACGGESGGELLSWQHTTTASPLCHYLTPRCRHRYTFLFPLSAIPRRCAIREQATTKQTHIEHVFFPLRYPRL